MQNMNIKTLLILILFCFSSHTIATIDYTKEEVKTMFPHAKQSCIDDFVIEERRITNRCSREIYRRLNQKAHCESKTGGVYVYDEAKRRSYCIQKETVSIII